MKAKFYLTLILSISVLFSIGQTTKQSGDWESNTIWNGKSPGLSLKKNATVTVETGHVVFLGTEQINKTLLLGKDNITLSIKGRLIIHGNLTVKGKKIDIKVADMGELIITGDVNFEQKQGGANQPELNISGAGSVTINGDVNSTGGGGNITGDGTINVDGDITGNIVITDDVIVTTTGSSDTYCPPTGLEGTVDIKNEMFRVTLIWEMETGCNPVKFRIKRTLGNDIEIFEDFNKSTSHEWIDNKDLTGISEPIYEVSAVYQTSDNSFIASKPVIYSYENNPLPIELLHFSAQPANGEIVVEWSTAAEINNDFFTIERSTDGNSWEPLAFVNGAGNTNYVIDYTYTDSNPIEGVSYYRLKQTDFDGQYEYFAPVAVNFSSIVSHTEIIRVVPRAQNMEIWFRNQDPSAVMTVADMQGRILYSRIAPVADFVQQISINLPRNYSGEVVMVNLRTNDKTDEVKIIVR